LLRLEPRLHIVAVSWLRNNYTVIGLHTYISFYVPVYYLFVQSTYTDVYSSQTVLQLFYAWSVNVPHIHTHIHTRTHTQSQWRTQEFWSGGEGVFQQIHLRKEDRENGDLGAVAP